MARNNNDLLMKAVEGAFHPQVRPVQNTDLAQYLLTHTFNGPSIIGKDLASKQGAESEKPGFLSRVLDVLSIPAYTSEGIISGVLKDTQKQHSDAKADNPITDILQPIGSAFKHLVPSVLGNASRSIEDTSALAGMTLGLDNAPVIGKLNRGVQDIAKNVANDLAPRKLGSDVLEQAGVKNKVAKYGGGFALDVLTDPTTYLTLGAGSAAKASKFANAEHGYRDASQILDEAAATGTKPVPNLDLFKKPAPVPSPSIARPVAEEAVRGKNLIPTPEPLTLKSGISSKPSLLQGLLGDVANNPIDLDAMKTLRRSDDDERAANARWGRPLDWHDIPEMTPADKADFADMFRDGKLAKAGKVTDGKGNISNRAVTQVLEDIRNGTVPRFGPMPDSAVGEAASQAQRVADELVSNLSKGTRKGRTTSELTPADQANLYNRVHNAAIDLVNTQYANRPARVLNPKQQDAADSIKVWLQNTRKKPTSEVIQKELAAQVKAKSINKTDAKAILRDFFPPEKIRNFASTKLGAEQVAALARPMLRSAEDHLLSKGIQPVYWNGMRVRLSDIMEEVGPAANRDYLTRVMDAMMHSDTKHISDPVVQEAINKALARRSLSQSDLLGSLSQKTLEAKNGIFESQPYAKARAILDRLPQAASDSVRSIGSTSAEAKAVKDQISNILTIDKLPTEQVLDTLPKDLIEAVQRGSLTGEEAQRLSKAVTETLQETPKSLMKDVTGNKIVDAVMTRFSTVFGRIPEMKRFEQDTFLYGELQANARTHWLRNMSRKYSRDQLNKAFIIAQQPERFAGESDEAVKEASQFFTNYYNAMLGSSGFDKITDLNGVAAVRSGMVMTDVNKHLRAIGSHFSFTDIKNAKSRVGEIPRNYSEKGLGWMRSWENADPTAAGQDPLSLLHDIDVALQRTVAEYSLYDEFGRRFGAKIGDAHFNPAIHKEIIPNPRLDGLHFHPEVRKAFQRQINDLESGSWMPKGDAMRMVTKATRAWKSSVTIYFPTHHIRNLIGDSYNMWYAGINDPTVFDRSIKVLASQKTRYAEALKSYDLDQLSKLINKDVLDALELSPTTSGKTIISSKKTGIKLTDEQLWASAYKRGLILNYNKTEDLFGETPMGAVFGTTPKNAVLKKLAAPFGGRAHHVAALTSEHREHFVRMAHYIGSIEKQLKSGRTDMAKIFDEAAHQVRKWHPDGSDLTQFEQKARILIPFYSWTRKEIPLLLQTMVQKPAKLIAYPKIQRAVAGSAGIDVNDDQGMLDPYPNDQLFPYWIRATGIGPIGDPDSNNAVASFFGKLGATSTGLEGQEQGYTVVNPSNPFQDVANQIFGFGRPQDSLRSMANSLTPGVQIPMQLISNQTFSGAPISKPEGGLGYTQYLLSQIPQAGTFTRLTGVGKDQKADQQGQNTQNLINLLTALGIRGTGPYQNSAEFEAKARSKYGN